MERTLGYIVGGTLVLRGLLVLTQPRLLARLWESRLRRHYPEPVNRLFGDFFSLSDTTIRVIGFWVLWMGGFVLWLTSRLSSAHTSDETEE